MIRPATPEDGDALQLVERLAGERFREVGLPGVADDEPPPAEDLAAYAAAGRSWVAIDPHGVPIGYVLVDVVDGCAHVEQLTVRPDHQGAGWARALLDRVREWAVATDKPGITLTTFADVPWNRPLFEHLGFHVVPTAEIGAELRSVRAAEAGRGLDPATRVCMRLDLGFPSAGRG